MLLSLPRLYFLESAAIFPVVTAGVALASAEIRLIIVLESGFTRLWIGSPVDSILFLLPFKPSFLVVRRLS